MKQKRTHAVVIGGSIAGCLAAETLSHHFDQVVIIEKSNEQDGFSERQSVPQEKHPHILLLEGARIFENIFPGLFEELKQKGAVLLDMTNDARWFHYGQWKKRYPGDMHIHFFSRSLLDSCIQARVRRNPKVKWLSNTTLKAIRFDQSPSVAGIDIEESHETRYMETRLVIDASGRGSRTAKMLENAGFGCVHKTLIETHLGYTSQLYKRVPSPSRDWQAMVIWPEPPHQKSLGVLLPIENDRWILSSGGWFNNFPKADTESLLTSLQQLPTRDLYDFIKTAEPISDISSFRFPGSRRWHYEQLPLFPDGLIVMGAALCSINPFFGQGMTLCGMQANRLSGLIESWQRNRITTRSIQQSFVQDFQTSWDMALEEDMRFPETAGKRTTMTRLKHWYGAGFIRLTASNEQARKMQLRITNLLEPPYKALQPAIASRIIYSELFGKTHSTG